MASIIDTSVPTGSFELIRDRIGQILSDELPRQATLQTDTDLNASVFIERFIPFNVRECPAITVSFPNGDFDQETVIKQNGIFTYHVDIFVSKVNIGANRGDYAAMVKLQKLTNVCRGILSHPKYKTLAFSSPFIDKVRVKNIQTAPSKSDSENMVIARIIVEIQAPSEMGKITPSDIEGYVTKAVLELTDKGYLYGGDAFEPPVTPVCADATETFNGVLISAISAGNNKDIIVKNNAATPVQVGTIITDNATSLIIEVPEGVAPVRLYAPPIYSGAIDRSVDYDTYWRKANNEGNLSQPAIGIQMRCAFGRQDILDPAITQGNIFGGMSRFTGTGGGYLNWLTGVYYDKDDVVTTRVLAYPNSLAIDHVQGLLVQIDQLGSQPWVNWLNNGQTLTIGAYTGFYLASVVEMVSFGNWGVTKGYEDDSPLFKWGSGLKLTSDTYAGSTTQAMVAQFYSHITSGSKGNSNKSIYIKYIDINADFGT